MEYPKSYPITRDVWMVPCRISQQKKSFKPIVSPIKNTDLMCFKRAKKKWNQNEDSLLSEIVSIRGPKNWSSISKELNFKLYDNLIVRTGKQCRERWFNHLDPEVTKSKWTEEEDRILRSKHLEFGNRWTKISMFFKGRTDSQLKNRWKFMHKGSDQSIIGEEENKESGFKLNRECLFEEVENSSENSKGKIVDFGRVSEDINGLLDINKRSGSYFLYSEYDGESVSVEFSNELYDDYEKFDRFGLMDPFLEFRKNLMKPSGSIIKEHLIGQNFKFEVQPVDKALNLEF